MVMAQVPDLAFRIRSSAVRGRYIEAAELAARIDERNEPRASAESCVAWLEVFFIGALSCEYIRDHQIHSFDALKAQSAAIIHRLTAALPGLQANEPSLHSRIRELKRTDDVQNEWIEPDWKQLIRSLDAILAEAPIDVIEDTARAIDDPALGYRARSVYDALRAFVRRHDPDHAEMMRIVGEQYQSGRLRIHDAAKLLGVSTSNAVFELEQDGFARPLSAVTLDDRERDAIYQRLRQQRRERTGAPMVDQELVDRDVIASERIEGVDARAWIRRR
jgi:hypothetical protein